MKGVRVLPQNVAPYTEGYDRRIDPRGRVYFWNNPEYACAEPHPDSDVTALADRFITVTPLQFNMTHVELLQRMGGWQWEV